MIALTSQLAHIVSSAYVKSPLAARHKGFSAGSFLDMTRVARLNEDMWDGAVLRHADMLSQELGGRIIERLEGYNLGSGHARHGDDEAASARGPRGQGSAGRVKEARACAQ